MVTFGPFHACMIIAVSSRHTSYLWLHFYNIAICVHIIRIRLVTATLISLAVTIINVDTNRFNSIKKWSSATKSQFLFLSFIQRALQLALNAGIPFIYVSANSGARLGLAEDLKLQFKVAWEDAEAPEKVSTSLLANPACLYSLPRLVCIFYLCRLCHWRQTASVGHIIKRGSR